MSRTARTLRAVVPIDVREAMATAQAAEREALAAVVAAQEVEAQAVAAYDAQDDDEHATAAAKAQVRRERAERVHAQRQQATREAQAAVDAADLAAAGEKYEGLVARVVALPERLRPHMDRLRDLRVQAAAVVDEVADVLVEMVDEFTEAERLAIVLGRPADLQRRAAKPSVREALALVQVAHDVADRRAARMDVSPWLTARGEPKWNDPAHDTYARIVARLKEAEVTRG